VTPTCSVIQGDALEVLRRFEDNTFGAIITDPPYASGGLHTVNRQAPTGVKYTSKKAKNPLPNFEGDNKDQLSWMLWSAAWLREAKRVCKKGAPICVFIDFWQLDALKWALQWADWLVKGWLCGIRQRWCVHSWDGFVASANSSCGVVREL
jgi:site-specific DNA-methyltransferase (adenine-specific)